jgi:hypothetical protein
MAHWQLNAVRVDERHHGDFRTVHLVRRIAPGMLPGAPEMFRNVPNCSTDVPSFPRKSVEISMNATKCDMSRFERIRGACKSGWSA